MPYRYVAVGLALSCERRLPGLLPWDGVGPSSERPVRVTFEGSDTTPVEPALWYREGRTAAGVTNLLYARTADGFLLRFPGDADFHIRPAEPEIAVSGSAIRSPRRLAQVLLNHVVTRLVGQSGELVLHASAVGIDDRAFGFLGDSFAGKSTLAASFALSGEGLFLGDDWLLLQPDSAGRILASSQGAAMRLRADSARRFGYDTPHGADKCVLASVASAPQTGRDAMPLAALLVLDTGDGGSGQAVEVEPIRGHAAVARLLAHAFMLDPRDPSVQAHLLRKAAAVLAAGTGVYRLSYPKDYALLGEIRRLVASLADPSAIA